LIFVGPKELPRFLGTLGRYAGMVRRQANEFRSVFEQAMREAELDQIQKEIRSVSEGVKTSLDQATRSVDDLKSAAKVELDAAAGQTAKPLPAGAPSAGTPAAATPAPETAALQTPAIGSSSGDTPAKSPPEKAEAASAEEKSTAGSA
jgi:sec-independent protein translocase protein TatB